VVVFVPIGFLTGTQISKVTRIPQLSQINNVTQKSQKGWLVAICVGMGLSVGIETLQFVLKRGFSEVDDVMHNTLGCLLGWFIVKGYLRLMVHG
jgi:glycopeptide antibiotics resistance protein